MDGGNVQINPIDRKRRKLTLNEKIEIIKQVDANPNVSKKEMSKRFQIASSSLSNILVQKDTITAAALTLGPHAMNKKNLKPSHYETLEKELMQWFVKMRAQNIAISAHMLRKQAFQISVDLNIANFGASNGWLERFKRRHGIIRQVNGTESTYTSHNDQGSWKSLLPLLTDGHNYKSIFTLGEVHFYYDLRPTDVQILNNSPDDFKKEIIVALLCCSIDGTEKIPPLVLGRESRETFLQNLCTLPCKYITSGESLLTSKILMAFLQELDMVMMSQQREIILFLEKSPVTLTLDTSILKHTKIVYYSDDVKPFSMELTPYFKTNYRKAFVRKLIAYEELNKELDFDLFQALSLIVSSWNSVPPFQIMETFRDVGFDFPSARNTPNDNEDFFEDAWEIVRGDLNITFRDYVSSDDKSPLLHHTDEKNIDVGAEESIIPSFGEAVAGFECFKKYLCSFEISENVVKQLTDLEWKLLFVSQEEQ